MIALLRGIVAESNFSGCILDVHGVGYEVAIPLSTFDKLPQPGGETIRVFTGISLCNIMGMRLLAQPLISLANLMFIELISFIRDG